MPGPSAGHDRVFVYDGAYAIAPTSDLVKPASSPGYNAVILACFYDVEVEATKEISQVGLHALPTSKEFK
ncbi:hypothetical protein ACFLTC_02745 [Chloroflexota bacterium]